MSGRAGKDRRDDERGGRDERDAQGAPMNDLTGNGIVNNGPENEPGGLGGGSPDDQDELILRTLLHSAVQDLEPSDGALDHLHRAVPVRRARKRQAMVGAAAAVLLFGTAIPAFVHVANSGGTSQDRAVSTGHGEETRNGTGGDKHDDPGEDADKPSGRTTDGTDDPDGTKKPGDSGHGSSGGGIGGGSSDPADTYGLSSPPCDPNQLGAPQATTNAPDASGTVYGTFRVENVSDTDCAVNTGGAINIQALGAADPGQIQVKEHTSGDAASGLPDPSQEAGALLLKPNTTYEVKFAWVPSETCPTTGASPDPTGSDGTSGGAPGDGSNGGSSGGSDPDAGANGGTGSGTTDAGDMAPQLAYVGGADDGSVSVSHTPEPGAPSATTTIANACAGTIYRTGVLGVTQ